MTAFMSDDGYEITPEDFDTGELIAELELRGFEVTFVQPPKWRSVAQCQRAYEQHMVFNATPTQELEAWSANLK